MENAESPKVNSSQTQLETKTPRPREKWSDIVRSICAVLTLAILIIGTFIIKNNQNRSYKEMGSSSLTNDELIKPTEKLPLEQDKSQFADSESKPFDDIRTVESQLRAIETNPQVKYSLREDTTSHQIDYSHISETPLSSYTAARTFFNHADLDNSESEY